MRKSTGGVQSSSEGENDGEKVSVGLNEAVSPYKTKWSSCFCVVISVVCCAGEESSVGEGGEK